MDFVLDSNRQGECMLRHSTLAYVVKKKIIAKYEIKFYKKVSFVEKLCFADSYSL